MQSLQQHSVCFVEGFIKDASLLFYFPPILELCASAVHVGQRSIHLEDQIQIGRASCRERVLMSV